jgi:hypothetical protein
MASSSASAPKKAKVGDFGRTSHLTASALEAVLLQVKKDGVPEHCSRKTIRRERHKVAYQNTEHGPLICHVDAMTKTGKTIALPLTSPAAMLSCALRGSSVFTDIMCGLLCRSGDSPGNPCRIILYSDEIIPNDALKSGTRKTNCV